MYGCQVRSGADGIDSEQECVYCDNRLALGACTRFVDLPVKGGGIFNGRRIQRRPQGGIKMDMSDYITQKLKAFKEDAAFKRQHGKERKLIGKERTKLKSRTMTSRFDALGPM